MVSGSHEVRTLAQIGRIFSPAGQWAQPEGGDRVRALRPISFRNTVHSRAPQSRRVYSFTRNLCDVRRPTYLPIFPSARVFGKGGCPLVYWLTKSDISEAGKGFAIK